MQHTPEAATYHASPFRRDDRPLVWAHRGASAYAPENTAPAFELARRQGADGIECDVMRCGSGELVVCHDERLDRLCGIPVAVRELPLAELRRLPVLAARFPGAGGTIPTFEEAVEVAGPAMRWNVELKVDRHADAEPLARAAAAAVARLGLEERVLASSFHPLALLTLRTAAPALPTAYLWEGDGAVLGTWHRAWGRITATAAVHPEHRLVDEAAVRRWHRAGLLVNTWTVDEPEELLRLRAAGVDGVITNRPDVAIATYAP
ncbi:glycerophosphodiester phosphodiesterase [Vulgatibacter sp.]|uniref:glycerophosphodiester phosphodiesterase n=1 Tax=Vulgatibacter sp. TaxID=1971226 RepID=UPI00356A4BDA